VRYRTKLNPHMVDQPIVISKLMTSILNKTVEPAELATVVWNGRCLRPSDGATMLGSKSVASGVGLTKNKPLYWWCVTLRVKCLFCSTSYWCGVN